MKFLKCVNNRFYSYFDKETKMLFTFKYGDRGVYGQGKAWYLTVTYDGAKQTIATFTVVSDNHNCQKNDYLGKLWQSGEALCEADKMISNMLSGSR